MKYLKLLGNFLFIFSAIIFSFIALIFAIPISLFRFSNNFSERICDWYEEKLDNIAEDLGNWRN